MPTSPLQRGVWFNEQLAALGPAYTVAVTVDLRGRVDVGRLARACTLLARSHPLLTAACLNLDGLPWLAIGAHPLALDVAAVTAGTVRDRVDRAVRTRFDLSAGPLARVRWYAVGADHGVLVLAAHHLIVDGQSKEILLRGLADHYRHDAATGRAVDPSPPATAGHRTPPDGAVAAACEYWWRNPPRPVDLHPGGGPRVAETVVRALARRTRARLADATAEWGVTRFEVLLTVLLGCLARDGPTRVAIEMSVRSPAEAGLTGMYVNELPLTFPPPAGGSFAATLATVRARLRELYAHRTVPLATCRPGSRPFLATAPLSVSYRRIAPDPIFDGLTAEVDWSAGNAVARNDLHVVIADGDRTHVTFQFPSSPGARHRADALIDRFLAVLDRSLTAPQAALVRPSEVPPPWT
ncbi:condensation domain-containing protein [Micromonospora rifamycinica]|uniref:condensation domain-containing protein n=1 Tax=Micromonospora rifamycinica TaxID=291594 RepID=UPI002E2E15C5|nr:condensation domain-containing protein [Micromonospora rifamycinica]